VLLITVAALGYFVDVYDLLLFNVVRIASLQSLGIPREEMMAVGKTLQNWQAWGLLLGGFCWGVLGDRKGRLSVLFGSIIVYSLANFLNGFVTSLWQYEVLRFVAGFGLAGELGAGIALASECMSKEKRGLGTMLSRAFTAPAKFGSDFARGRCRAARDEFFANKLKYAALNVG
jgi:MFS family permease